jgi:hypothetical protein
MSQTQLVSDLLTNRAEYAESARRIHANALEQISGPNGTELMKLTNAKRAERGRSPIREVLDLDGAHEFWAVELVAQGLIDASALDLAEQRPAWADNTTVSLSGWPTVEVKWESRDLQVGNSHILVTQSVFITIDDDEDPHGNTTSAGTVNLYEPTVGIYVPGSDPSRVYLPIESLDALAELVAKAAELVGSSRSLTQ